MKNFGTAMLYLVTGLIFVVGGAWIASKVIKPSSTPVVRPFVACPPDFLSYTTLAGNTDSVVKLIDVKKPMFASNGKFVNSQVILTKSETDKSKVACGYLFIRAGTSRGALLPTWEDVYLNPNGFGGHLVSDSAISVNDGKQYSEYLYPLDKIKYWDTHYRKNTFTADWTALLNVSTTVSFTIALNTIDPDGFIGEVSIAYKCWNPATGEPNSGCKLSVISSKDEQTTNPIQ